MTNTKNHQSQVNYYDFTITLKPFILNRLSLASLDTLCPKSTYLCHAGGSVLIKTCYYICHVKTHKTLSVILPFSFQSLTKVPKCDTLNAIAKLSS